MMTMKAKESNRGKKKPDEKVASLQQMIGESQDARNQDRQPKDEEFTKLRLERSSAVKPNTKKIKMKSLPKSG